MLVAVLILTTIGAPQADLNLTLYSVMREHSFVSIDDPLPGSCGFAAMREKYSEHYLGPRLTDEQFKAVVEKFQEREESGWNVRLSDPWFKKEPSEENSFVPDACFVDLEYDDGSTVSVHIWQDVIAFDPVPKGLGTHIEVIRIPSGAPLDTDTSNRGTLYEKHRQGWKNYSDLLVSN